MGYFINQIVIPPQGNVQQLLLAFTNALADEFGWYADTSDAFTPYKVYDSAEKNLGVFFESLVNASDNSIWIGITNGVNEVPSSLSESVSMCRFSTGTSYCINYVKSSSGTVTAIGISLESGDPALYIAFATNSKGERVAINPSNHTSNTIAILRRDGYYARSYSVVTVMTGTNLCTSLVKLPDIFGNAIYPELYALYSCPSTTTTNLTLLVDGKYYRTIGFANKARLAFPVG